jgi:branched-chain amino acid transport system permease protein
MLFVFLRYTDLGKALRAVTDNKQGAKIVGIYLDRVYVVAFSMSTVIAGVAGVVLIPVLLVGPFSGMDFLTKAFVAVVIGGLGSIPGAIVGGLVIGCVESVASVFLSKSYGNAISCFIMILVLIFKPSGLFGKSEG